MKQRPGSILQKLDYPVPGHANRILYMFGGISTFAFLILIMSGIYMSQAYYPTPDKAYSSVIYAVTQVPLADFMRSLHFWTANLVVGLLVLHVIRVFITGSYKKPRRLTWLTGVALLAVTIIYIFAGTVLKADQEGIEALGHMRESFEFFGIGIGMTNVGVPVITQVYTWHTTILLLLLIGLLAVHMVLIKLRGISSKPVKGAVSETTAGRGSSGFILHLKRLTGFGFIFLAIAGLMAILLPAPLGFAGIPDQEVTEPLWMFWPFFGLENIFGLKGLVWGLIGFFVILAAVPFLDRSPYLNWRKRKLTLLLGSLFFATVIGLGVYSKVVPVEIHLSSDSPSSVTEMATADTVDISHTQLRKDAFYLVPTLIVIGGAGVWLAGMRQRIYQSNKVAANRP